MTSTAHSPHPPSLTPRYGSAVNEPIELYRGPATLIVNGAALTTDVLIRFNLLHPQGPEVVCAAMVGTLDAATELQVPSIGLVARVQGRYFHLGTDGPSFIGVLAGDVEIGSRTGLHRVGFHVANMPSVLGDWVTQGERTSRARIPMTDGVWQVEVDAVAEAFGATKLADQINEVGGFAITHVGALRRIDGAAFTAEDADAVLRDVSRTLCFARGGWACPFLMAGVDGTGQVIWQSWSSERTSPFCVAAQWFPTMEPTILNSIFNGWRRIMSTPQGDTINAALHVYLDAQERGLANESRLVLAQAALEGLASGWPHAAPGNAQSVAAINGDAAKGIATMSLSLGLDLRVPAALTDLAALAKPTAQATVFEKMAWVRNSIAHLNNFPRLSGVNWRAKHEASEFAFWVLELALLRLLDADGQYLNRLRGTDVAEKLPWKA